VPRPASLGECVSDGQKTAETFFGARMQIFASGRDGAVAEGGLHQMNRGSTVESVRTVRVPHPVRGETFAEAGRFPALLLPLDEYRTI
jgi:hypothetical protein